MTVTTATKAPHIQAGHRKRPAELVSEGRARLSGSKFIRRTFLAGGTTRSCATAPSSRRNASELHCERLGLSQVRWVGEREYWLGRCPRPLHRGRPQPRIPSCAGKSSPLALDEREGKVDGTSRDRRPLPLLSSEMDRRGRVSVLLQTPKDAEGRVGKREDGYSNHSLMSGPTRSYTRVGHAFVLSCPTPRTVESAGCPPVRP
jgi:hypothetical protein